MVCGLVALGFALALGRGPAAHAQILPSSTTTTAPSLTTTTLATTTTTALATTTTTAAATTTSAPRRTTTTRPGPTTTAFVPPSGVPATSAPPAASTEPLDPSLTLLPWFVTLSLGGFAVAVAILTVQWIRTRGGRR